MGINEIIRLNGLTKPRNKRKVVTQAAHEEAKTAEVCVELDYPRQDEKITSPVYVFRIGTSGDAERVELSINKGPWQPCRHAAGYWWYDWSGYLKGRHQAVVRTWTKSGQEVASAPRKFQVV